VSDDVSGHQKTLTWRIQNTDTIFNFVFAMQENNYTATTQRIFHKGEGKDEM
jgi:hypothetical protein